MFKNRLVTLALIGIFLPSQGWTTVTSRVCDELFASPPTSRAPRELRGTERVYPLRSIKMFLRYREIDARMTIQFSAEEKSKMQVVLKNGLFFDATGATANYGYPQNFVIDLGFNLYAFASSRSMRNGLKTSKHSSVTAGERTHFAGEAVFENGKLIYLSNKSGHYAPLETDLLAALLYLNAQGVDLSETTVERYNAHTSLKSGQPSAYDFIRGYIPDWQP